MHMDVTVKMEERASIKLFVSAVLFSPEQIVNMVDNTINCRYDECLLLIQLLYIFQTKNKNRESDYRQSSYVRMIKKPIACVT